MDDTQKIGILQGTTHKRRCKIGILRGTLDITIRNYVLHIFYLFISFLNFFWKIRSFKASLRSFINFWYSFIEKGMLLILS